MDAKAGLEERATELRSQISHTQRELGDKVDSLEDRVRTMAHNVGETVRRSIDVRERIRERPLLSCVLATGVGVLLGRRLRQRRDERFEEFRDAPVIGGWGLAEVLAPEIAALRALLVTKGISMVSRFLRVEPRQEEGAGEQRVH